MPKVGLPVSLICLDRAVPMLFSVDYLRIAVNRVRRKLERFSVELVFELQMISFADFVFHAMNIGPRDP
jgi:hypothetical protein